MLALLDADRYAALHAACCSILIARLSVSTYEVTIKAMHASAKTISET